MKYQAFTPPDDTEDVPSTLPTREQLLAQIEAEHYAESQARPDSPYLAVLDERHAAVAERKSDQAARNAYARATATDVPELVPAVAPELTDPEEDADDES